MQKISQKIIDRIKREKGQFKSSDNVSKYLEEDDLGAIEQEVKIHFEELLRSLIIDVDNDIHTKETAKRMAHLFIHEILRGRYQNPPKVTTFENQTQYQNMLILAPIKIHSLCSHHFVPVIGQAYVGIIPGDKIWGISKFSRLINWFMARPHVQEDATKNLALLIEEKLKPKGLIIHMIATHFCMTWRGVREHETEMITMAVHGEFEKEELRREFFRLLELKKFAYDDNTSLSAP